MNAGTVRGFSFIELVVAMAIMLVVSSSKKKFLSL